MAGGVEGIGAGVDGLEFLGEILSHHKCYFLAILGNLVTTTIYSFASFFN